MELVSIEPELKLIPKWNKNHELPAGEQVAIYFHRIPGTSEKKKYNNFRFDTSARSIEMVNEDSLVCQTFIKKVENLKINNKYIKNGVELSSANHPALEGLFEEIRNHLFPTDEAVTVGESQA